MRNPLVKLGLGFLATLGLGKSANWRRQRSPFEKDRRAFEEDVKAQLLKLKEKGLSLPIFTL